MATKPRSPLETKRPRRAAGVHLRRQLKCPLCSTGEPKTVAYRKRSALLECTSCGLRFNVAPMDVGNNLRLKASEIWEARQGDDPMAMFATLTGKATARDDAIRAIREAGKAIVLGFWSRASDTPAQRAAKIKKVEGAKTKQEREQERLALVDSLMQSIPPEARAKMLG